MFHMMIFFSVRLFFFLPPMKIRKSDGTRNYFINKWKDSKEYYIEKEKRSMVFCLMRKKIYINNNAKIRRQKRELSIDLYITYELQ